MKKFFVTLMASMLLLSSTTYAVEMSKSHIPTQMTTMSKSEAIQMLKDAGVEPSKIAMLEHGEMAKTEGEFWPIVYWLAIGALSYLNAPSHNDHIYSGPVVKPRWRWRR